MPEAIITFFDQHAKVACDGNCVKAWGSSSRPAVKPWEEMDDGEEIVYLRDAELGEAPTDPGTYEGSDAKPDSAAQFPNKWCVRECERCAMSRPGEWQLPLELPVF